MYLHCVYKETFYIELGHFLEMSHYLRSQCHVMQNKTLSCARPNVSY